MLARCGGRGDGGVVAGEDALEEVGGGRGVDVVGADDPVGVAVADDLEVEVVGGSAAGEHRVELLAALGAGGQSVHGVGGDALGAVDGGGVPELGGRCDVVRREGDPSAGAGVLHRQAPVGCDVVDGPAVAVLDPVVHREPQPAVVAAGDDGVADIPGVAVGQPHPRATVESMIERHRCDCVIRCDWARRLSSATRSRVGASMSASRPWSRSRAQAWNTPWVRVARSPTWTRPWSR